MKHFDIKIDITELIDWEKQKLKFYKQNWKTKMFEIDWFLKHSLTCILISETSFTLDGLVR